MPGTKRGNQAAVRVERRPCHPRRPCSRSGTRSRSALRVAADARRREVLDAALQLVRAEHGATTAGATRWRSAGGCCAPSGSVESKYGPLYCRLAGTPEHTAREERRVDDCGARAAGILQLPVLLRVLRLGERARAEHAAPARRDNPVRRRRRREGRRVDAGAERRLMQRRAVVDEAALQRVPWRRRARSAWPRTRVLSFVVANGIRRLRERALASSSASARAPPKNHRRSRTSGPPAVASKVGDSLLARVVPAAFSNGVSSLHAGFVRLVRNAPENVLPPLRVITLTTPPLKRPYSARDAGASATCTSWIASSMNRLLAVPSTLSLMSTPFIRNTLS